MKIDKPKIKHYNLSINDANKKIIINVNLRRKQNGS